MKSDIGSRVRSGEARVAARRLRRSREAGLVTAEYAVATCAAAAFAAVLLAVINAGGIGNLIGEVISSALQAVF